MTKKEILFLISILVAVIVFFLIATPPRVKVPMPTYYPKGWQKASASLKDNYKISGMVISEEDYSDRRREILEKEMNVTLDYTYLSPEAITRKMALMFAAGTRPDFFLLPAGYIRKFAKNGYLMELPHEMLAKYCPNLVRLINTYQPNAWQATLDKNELNRALPFLWADGLYPKTAIWRQDWLENVGIKKTPDNLEEMHEALTRFTFNDPDGNGIKDTYGMSGSLKYSSLFTEIFGAYNASPFCWIKKDGVPVWGGIQPETKEVLKLMRQWYKEGIIHPDFLTDDVFMQCKQKFTNGKTGYIDYICWYENFDKESPTSLINVINTLQPGSKITPGIPPLGPAGIRKQRIAGVIHFYTLAFSAKMYKQPEKVIRILKMFDKIYGDEDTFVKYHIGTKGKHWDWRDKKVGRRSGAVLLEPYKSDTLLRRRTGLMSPEYLLTIGDPAISKKYLPEAKIEFNRKYRDPKWGNANIFYYLPRSDEYAGDLGFMQLRVFSEIIIGEKPLSYFDEFVETWRKQGGDILTHEAKLMDELTTRVLKKLKLEKKADGK